MTTTAIDQWQTELEDNGSVTFGADRRRLTRLAAIPLVFTIMGVFLIVTGSLIVGLIAVVFFGGPALIVSVLVLRGGRSVVVDKNGIASRRQRVAWSKVTAIEVWSHSRVQMVLIGVSSDVAIRIRPDLNRLQRLAEPANERLIGHSAMYLPATNAFDADDMCTWLNQLLAAHRSA